MSALKADYLIVTVEDIARICHEANRGYCQSLGDDSQVPWEEAPAWQRASAIEGVKFHLANGNSTPGDSHRSWLRHKAAEGWSWGPVKDPEKKTHPCMRPFEDLPKRERAKDFIFTAIVKAMARGVVGVALRTPA